MRQECARTVRASELEVEARRSEQCFDLAAVEGANVVDLGRTSGTFGGTAPDTNPSSQQAAGRILYDSDLQSPVRSSLACLIRHRCFDRAFNNIEYEQPAWLKRIVHATEQRGQVQVVDVTRQVREALTDRRDCRARRNVNRMC